MKYSFIINCFGIFYKEDLNFTELILFVVVCLSLVSVLLLYYNKIKSNNKMNNSDVSIYSSKDVFSQEIVGETNFVLAKKTTSVWSKIAIYGLIVLMIMSSMSELLGISESF